MTSKKLHWEEPNPPRVLLAIDPGAADKKRSKKYDEYPYAGCALFIDGWLKSAKTVVCPTLMMRREVTWVRPPRIDNKQQPLEMFEHTGSKKVARSARANVLVRTVCEEMKVPRHGGGAYAITGKTRGAAKGGMGGDGDGAWCNKCGRGGTVDQGEAITVLAVEKPTFRPNSPARPQDIVELRGIYGAFVGGVDADFYSTPEPEEWKGTFDGEQLNERVLLVLSSTERALIQSSPPDYGALTSHALDAIGLGLFTLGRAGKGMVI